MHPPPGHPRAAVLQVVLSLAPGGTEKLVVETVRRLHGRIPMAVCCLDEPGLWGEALEREGVPVVALHRAPGFSPRLGHRLAEVARRFGARVLHCHQYTPFVYGAIAKLTAPRLRVVFTEHGRVHDGPPSRKRRIANSLLARLPDQVCAVSGELRRHMIAEGFGPDAVSVVLNGTDVGDPPDEDARREGRALLGAAQDGFVIGAVGRLDPVKDLGTLVDAFGAHAAAHPRAELVVVGDGPERHALTNAVAAAGLASRVRFLGHRADVRRLLPGLDLYVNSSIFEGISLTMLEAMAAEVPVVATAVGGTPEVVEDGVTGILVPPRDRQALTQALAWVAGRWSDRQGMGRRGRERVCARFSMETMIATYSAAYRELQGHAQCVA